MSFSLSTNVYFYLIYQWFDGILRHWFVYLFLFFYPSSHPLKTCLWAPVAWTKADLLPSPHMVTICPLRVWSVSAPQPPICRARWTDRCPVSHQLNTSSSVCLFLFFSPSSPVSVLLRLLSNTAELRGRSSAKGWCHLLGCCGRLELGFDSIAVI